jgi:hypothetical protein
MQKKIVICKNKNYTCQLMQLLLCISEIIKKRSDKQIIDKGQRQYRFTIDSTLHFYSPITYIR